MWKTTQFWKTKEKINEIERLKEEVKNNKDELWDCLLDGEINISKILTDLEYEKHGTLNNIAKLIKLGITPIQIDKIKKSVLSS